MHHLWHTVTVLAAVSIMAACAHQPVDRSRFATSRGETTVRVKNDRFLNATIYLLRGAHRTRLGTVSGYSSETFIVPSHMMSGLTELRFLVDPIGERETETTDVILTEPGEMIELMIRREGGSYASRR